MNVLERVMGWINHKPAPDDAELVDAQRRLTQLAAKERRKALTVRFDARRRPLHR